MTALLGLILLYSTVHFFIIQHKKTWEQRNTYEKVVTIVCMLFLSLTLIGIMAE